MREEEIEGVPTDVFCQLVQRVLQTSRWIDVSFFQSMNNRHQHATVISVRPESHYIPTQVMLIKGP
jgi:hypothetical protein